MPSKRAYDRTKAVEYAHKWAFGRNPAYFNYDNFVGDCTNFASQCLYAGSGVMNYKPVYGWYYINGNRKAPAWTGVPFLYNFLVNNKTLGPYGHLTDAWKVLPGDLVQLSFGGGVWAHTPVIVAVDSPPTMDNILVAAHTYDSDNRPISSYSYEKIRFIHIDGVLV